MTAILEASTAQDKNSSPARFTSSRFQLLIIVG